MDNGNKKLYLTVKDCKDAYVKSIEETLNKQFDGDLPKGYRIAVLHIPNNKS